MNRTKPHNTKLKTREDVRLFILDNPSIAYITLSSKGHMKVIHFINNAYLRWLTVTISDMLDIELYHLTGRIINCPVRIYLDLITTKEEKRIDKINNLLNE